MGKIVLKSVLLILIDIALAMDIRTILRDCISRGMSRKTDRKKYKAQAFWEKVFLFYGKKIVGVKNRFYTAFHIIYLEQFFSVLLQIVYIFLVVITKAEYINLIYIIVIKIVLSFCIRFILIPGGHNSVFKKY